jgi:hypothetical protein
MAKVEFLQRRGGNLGPRGSGRQTDLFRADTRKTGCRIEWDGPEANRVTSSGDSAGDKRLLQLRRAATAVVVGEP